MQVVMKLVRVASNRHLRNWEAPDASLPQKHLAALIDSVVFQSLKMKYLKQGMAIIPI